MSRPPATKFLQGGRNKKKIRAPGGWGGRKGGGGGWRSSILGQLWNQKSAGDPPVAIPRRRGIYPAKERAEREDGSLFF